ncbi:hypothetical protein GPALN_007491 [Globodera pallida]|nr:hypothetical protein GPALN_007491 [Globodera pallida]
MEEYHKQLQQNIDAKMKEYQKQLQQNIDAKMKEYQKQLQQNIDAKMKECQKQQQQNIVDLQKTFAMLNDTIGKGLIPQQNRWDSAACHNKLTFIEPGQLIVQFIGNNLGYGVGSSVLAEQPIPKSGIFYFEVRMLAQHGDIHIGLASNQMPLDKMVGWDEGTYAYASGGAFLGHAVEGCSSYGTAFIGGKPSFGVGDVIGCGVHLATCQIIYTKNGRRLETAGLFIDSAAELFPCISLSHCGDKIVAYFGPDFKFKF